MPCRPRLDAPGVLRYAIVRGVERRALFRDDIDRADFLADLVAPVSATGLTVYVWAFLSNHAHLLVRTGSRCIPAIILARK